jgi:hypothetical protein
LDLPYLFCLVHECVQNWNDLLWDMFHFVTYTFTLALGMQYIKKLCKINCPCAHDLVHSKEDTTILDLVVLIFHHNYAIIQSLEPRKRTQESTIVLGFWVGSTRRKFTPSTCGPSISIYHRQYSVQILSPSPPIILDRSRFLVPNILFAMLHGVQNTDIWSKSRT